MYVLFLLLGLALNVMTSFVMWNLSCEAQLPFNFPCLPKRLHLSDYFLILFLITTCAYLLLAWSP